MKNCGTSDESCYSLIVGGSAAKIILSDGVMIYFATLDANCSMYLGSGSLANGCAFADVDINGNKKPNIGGKDIFSFWITKNGFVPYGTPKQKANDSASDPVSFARCEQDHGGRGCAAWVIYNENMDYLHCDGLSWTGKTKCD
ncbi:hypothetical protein KBA27_02935, partial [bacterium]|nr:hypothetical protein [bacterium]